MFTFLLIVHALIAASLVIVILMQRSEGGGLTGGSPSGLMTARGAADFLTRATAVLATMFVLSSIFLAVLATVTNAPAKIDTSLAKPGANGPAPATAPAPGAVPLTGQPATPAGGTTTDPLAGIAINAAAPVSNQAVPLQR
jgi:preprotein translocase subunit SecG